MHRRHRRLAELRRTLAELLALARRPGADWDVLDGLLAEATDALTIEHARGLADCNDLELHLLERCLVAARELLDRQARQSVRTS